LLSTENKAQINGALFQLRAGNAAEKNGFKVLKISNPFYDDPSKIRTDIDLILEAANGKKIAVGFKTYGNITADIIHRDANTLEYFVQQDPGTLKVFMVKEEPSKLTRKILEDKYGCIVFAGDPEAQIMALKLLKHTNGGGEVAVGKGLRAIQRTEKVEKADKVLIEF
jgi:hypothetical protein